MAATLLSSNENKDGATIIYGNSDVNYISNKLNKIFLNEKYKLEEGSLEKGSYGTGNAAMRILFGAFVKRFKFSVNIYNQDNNVVFEFKKAMSGASGGYIGMKKLDKEVQRLLPLFKAIN